MGPFTVTGVGTNTVTLDLPPILRIHPTVNVAQVREYYGRPEVLGGEQVATTVEVDGELQYIVECVCAKRVLGKTVQYLVKWEGADMSQATWEPAGNLPGWAVALYENRHPKAGAPAADFEGEDLAAAERAVAPGAKARRQQTAPADWEGLLPVAAPGRGRGRPPMKV